MSSATVFAYGWTPSTASYSPAWSYTVSGGGDWQYTLSESLAEVTSTVSWNLSGTANFFASENGTIFGAAPPGALSVSATDHYYRSSADTSPDNRGWSGRTATQISGVTASGDGTAAWSGNQSLSTTASLWAYQTLAAGNYNLSGTESYSGTSAFADNFSSGSFSTSWSGSLAGSLSQTGTNRGIDFSLTRTASSSLAGTEVGVMSGATFSRSESQAGGYSLAETDTLPRRPGDASGNWKRKSHAHLGRFADGARRLDGRHGDGPRELDRFVCGHLHLHAQRRSRKRDRKTTGCRRPETTFGNEISGADSINRTQSSTATTSASFDRPKRGDPAREHRDEHLEHHLYRVDVERHVQSHRSKTQHLRRARDRHGYGDEHHGQFHGECHGDGDRIRATAGRGHTREHKPPPRPRSTIGSKSAWASTEAHSLTGWNTGTWSDSLTQTIAADGTTRVTATASGYGSTALSGSSSTARYSHPITGAYTQSLQGVQTAVAWNTSTSTRTETFTGNGTAERRSDANGSQTSTQVDSWLNSSTGNAIGGSYQSTSTQSTQGR